MTDRGQPLFPAPTATTEEVIDGRLMVYCERSGRVYDLDADRSVIWALCDGRDLGAVIEDFGKHKLDVDGAEVGRYVEATVVEFLSSGLLDVVEGAGSLAELPPVRERPGGG